MPAVLIHVPSAPVLNGQSRVQQMSRMQQDLAAAQKQQTENDAKGNRSMHGTKMMRRLASKVRKPRVAIVGAGFAGLRAADILLSKGVSVTIFEARNRIGGRLYQHKVGKHSVDMGPNWIHGTQNNPILDLVRSTGTETHDWGEQQVAVGPDGTVIPQDEAADNAELLWGLIGDAFKYSNSESANIDPKSSLMDYILENVDERLSRRLHSKEASDSAYEEEAKRRKRVIVKLAEMWGGFIGGTTNIQSLKFLWLEECLEGENLFCAGTYAKVLEHVAKPALTHADIRFEHVVEKVTSSLGEGTAVTVSLKGREAETFDEVIVTCPLGWLKRHKDAFEPALSTRISQAIDNLGYGNLDKVYLTFEHAWWDHPGPETIASKTHIEVREAKAEVSNVTATNTPLHQPPTSMSEEQHYAGFTAYIGPEYAQETNPDGWFQDCINLAALPPPSAHPTLLFYISGPTADHIASILRNHDSALPATEPDNKHKNTALQSALWSFFHPYVSRLPHYSATKPSCTPTDILATGWTNDEYAGYGSYTNFPVGSTQCDEDVEALREGKGLVERGVWLAGEHCAPFVALGTVTGAWWAGEAVAGRVCGMWGLE